MEKFAGETAKKMLPIAWTMIRAVKELHLIKKTSAVLSAAVGTIKIRAGSRPLGRGASYLWLLLRSWIHATSGLLGEATFKGISTPGLRGGVVRGSRHFLISA